MKTIYAFQQQMDKMELAEDAWEDMVDLFDGDAIESESDAVINQVLDEIGVRLGNQMQAAPTHPVAGQRVASTVPSTAPPQRAAAQYPA